MASSRRGWIIWIWMVRCSLYYVEWVDVFGGFLCPLYKNKLCVIIVCFSCVEIGHVIVGRLRMNVILRTKQRIQSYSPPPLFLDSYPDLFRLTRCWLNPLIRSTSAESYGRFTRSWIVVVVSMTVNVQYVFLLLSWNSFLPPFCTCCFSQNIQLDTEVIPVLSPISHTQVFSIRFAKPTMSRSFSTWRRRSRSHLVSPSSLARPTEERLDGQILTYCISPKDPPP